ncbi:C4-dicarboxylate TRAP transporter substrate-binding protein [Alteromonas pelagimontana]|nr:C4-dicarboxylate TRAP transporter substrate-binding protein [Alteromonas pelagimontana]
MTSILFLLFPGSASAVTQLNVITALSSNDPMYKGLEEFKRLVEQNSQRSIEIRLFLGSQLGNDDDMLEQAMLGANVAVLADAGRLSIYQHELGILSAPYLVRDANELKTLVTSPLFANWAETLAREDELHIFSFNWWQGARHLLTQKKVTEPADLDSVRMRTIGMPVWIETIRAMGATPTPLSWSEVYSGLQQKVIDAAEAQFTGMWGARLYEVVSHVTKTGHIQLLSGLVGSKKWFDALTPKQQKVVTQAAIKAGDHASDLVRHAEASIVLELKEKGVEVTDIDTNAFEQATRSVYPKLGYAKLHQQVQAYLQEPGR